MVVAQTYVIFNPNTCFNVHCAKHLVPSPSVSFANLMKYIKNHNSQLRDELEQRAIRFPYSIKVLKNGKPQKLFYYDEAAEMDYDLNWAVDTHWKVFATVLGYCNSEYTIREPATFMSFYSLYTEDVLDLIMDDWYYYYSYNQLYFKNHSVDKELTFCDLNSSLG